MSQTQTVNGPLIPPGGFIQLVRPRLIWQEYWNLFRLQTVTAGCIIFLFWKRRCSADAVPLLSGKLVLILPTSEG